MYPASQCLDRGNQLMRLHRFREMCLVARLRGFNLVFGTHERGERDSRYFSTVTCGESPDFAYELVSILTWHAYIAYYHVGLMLLYDIQPFVSGGGADHLCFMRCKHFMNEP